MEPIDCLRKTKEYLADPKRWHKGSAANESGDAYCLIGAVSVSRFWIGDHFAGYEEYNIDDDVKVGNVISEVFKTLRSLVPDEYEGGNIIANFNDHPDTTHEDIMNLINQGILELSKETAGSEPSTDRELVAV